MICGSERWDPGKAAGATNATCQLETTENLCVSWPGAGARTVSRGATALIRGGAMTDSRMGPKLFVLNGSVFNQMGAAH
jgi:hypothetical protein